MVLIWPLLDFLQELSVWAYPKNPGVYEDALVCCIKENPEPIIFKLLTYGVRPELELDKKVLHFDKVLLHRSVMLIPPPPLLMRLIF